MEKKIIMKIFFIMLGVFLLVAGVSAGLCINAYKDGSGLKQSEQIVKSVKIDDNEVGGLTLSETEAIVQKHVDKLLNRTISVKVGNKIYTPAYKDLGFSYDVKGAIDKAYNYGRSGNPIKDILAINGIGVYNISVDEIRNDEVVYDYIMSIANKGAKPKDASLYRDNGKIFVVPSQSAITIDKAKANEMLMEAINNNYSEVTLPVKEDLPKITTESLNKINTRLASYDTDYNPGKVGRSANLALACKKINAHIIMPGEVFAFNKVVGPRTTQNGFKNAIIFEAGQEVEGLGGGICQVSSTVFNAALLSNMEIVQRRCHSLKVVYVPLGRDAMVSYGSSDFQFKNNNKNPVVIFANAYRGKLNVEIWGNSSDKKTCSISSSVGDGGYYAKITRYIVDGNGNKTANYSASSVYQRPRPKANKEKPKTTAPKKGSTRASVDEDNTVVIESKPKPKAPAPSEPKPQPATATHDQTVEL